MISFNETPTTNRINFVSAEFDNSKSSSGPALLSYNGLLIVQKTSNGTAEDSSIHGPITTPEQVVALAGADSVGIEQARAWFANNTSTELDVAFLADNAAGTAAAGSVQFLTDATADGTLHFYSGGKYVPVAISEGDTPAEQATALSDAMGDLDESPVTVSASTDTATFTANNKGLLMNGHDLRVNYQRGQSLPGGVSLTITQMTGGDTNPLMTDLIANMGDDWYQVIEHPYTDAVSLSAFEDEMALRFTSAKSISGMLMSSAAGNLSELVTLGNTRNSPHLCIVGQTGWDTVSSPHVVSAAVAGVLAYYAAIDPARPMQTLRVRGVLPALGRYKDEERNILLHNGIATLVEGPGGVVNIERLITTYKKNATGGDDVSYLDVTTLLTMLYIRYSWITRQKQKYPRHKLADDGTKVAAGQAIMTPLIGKADAIGWWGELEELGLVENTGEFEQNLIVERNAQDVNRLDYLLPPNLINKLIGSAAKIQFGL